MNVKWAIIVATILSLASECRAEATLAKFRRITIGMTYNQVKSILGVPDKEHMSMDLGEHRSDVLQWYGKDENTGAILGFHDGKVSSKTQVGLE